MGLIREPLDVDFVVDPRPLTKKEELAISEFTKADKAKREVKLKYYGLETYRLEAVTKVI